MNGLRVIRAVFLCAVLVFVPLSCESGVFSSVRAVDKQSFTNSVGMRMICLSSGYYVATYETTQSEFEKVMEYNPSEYKAAQNPVENLTTAEALEFCKKLTERERIKGSLPKGYHYDLPTFDQWVEYASGTPRKGSITPAASGGVLTKELDHALKVGSGERNRLGLYDIRGNVSEWCKDLGRPGHSNLILGPWWNSYRKDELWIRNKGYFNSQDITGGHCGFRYVLVKD